MLQYDEPCSRCAASSSLNNSTDQQGEPKGRRGSRIKACRLGGVPLVHTVPQCGPGNGYTGAFSGISSSFLNFCANGHVMSNTRASSRFDILLTVMLTAATNSVGSTAAQLRNTQPFRKSKEVRLQLWCREKEDANSPVNPPCFAL